MQQLTSFLLTCPVAATVALYFGSSSLCPITLEGDRSSPAFGYNPALLTIVDRVRRSLR